MELTTAEFNVWVDTYVKYYDDSTTLSGLKPDFWAVEWFMNPGNERSELCWAAILKILETTSSDSVLANLAAGPLEDLIECHGSKFIDRIENESRINPCFRELLGGVWKCSSPAVWERIEKARNYGRR